LGRDRRGKGRGVVHLRCDENIKWAVENTGFGSWAKSLIKEVDRIVLGFIWEGSI